MNPAPTGPKSPAAAAPRKKSKKLWWIIGGVVLVGALVYGGYRRRQQSAQAQPVSIDKAITKTITQVVTATGKVQPEVEVKISTEAAGEIVELPLKEGAKVKKGDLLVKIKPDFYQAQLDQQEANLTAAKASAVQANASLLKAKDDLKRNEDLFNKKLISDSDILASRTGLDIAQANYENALAQIRRTEGSLTQARDTLAKTIIYSPMDGTISAENSELGERVVGTGSFAG